MKVYVDMDRVICDFDNGVRKYGHMDPPGQENEGLSVEMWKRLSKVPHFYDKLEPMPGSEKGICVLREMFGRDLEVLTGVPNPTRGLPTSSDDKKNWMKRYFGPGIVVNTVLRKEKKNFCTGPDCVLIDDYDLNIREWEKTGGTGILFESWEQVLDTISGMFSHVIK